MSRLNWINPKDYTFDHMLLLDRGWEELAYEGAFGLTTYRYRKQIHKK